MNDCVSGLHRWYGQVHSSLAVYQGIDLVMLSMTFFVYSIHKLGMVWFFKTISGNQSNDILLSI